MVMMTAEVTQTWEHIFSHKRDKAGMTIEDKHLYNLDTIRIREEGGDTSERWLYVVLWHYHPAVGEGKLLAHSISCLEAINSCVCVHLTADMAGKS